MGYFILSHPVECRPNRWPWMKKIAFPHLLPCETYRSTVATLLLCVAEHTGQRKQFSIGRANLIKPLTYSHQPWYLIGARMQSSEQRICVFYARSTTSGGGCNMVTNGPTYTSTIERPNSTTNRIWVIFLLSVLAELKLSMICFRRPIVKPYTIVLKTRLMPAVISQL